MAFSETRGRMYAEKQLAVRVVNTRDGFAFIGISGTEPLQCLGFWTSYTKAIREVRELGFDVVNEQRDLIVIACSSPTTYANQTNTETNPGNATGTTEGRKSESESENCFSWLPSAKI